MNLPAIISNFTAQFGVNPTFVIRAPGRVNLLGEHVDYNAGPVLPAAIDRAVYIAGSPISSESVHLHASDMGEEVSFSLNRLEKKVDLEGNPLPEWACYPAGVAWALQGAGLETKGFQAIFTSNVPIGAGLSSSAAIEIGFAVTWQTLGGWSTRLMTLAQLCQKAENEYVGVACGLMDQFASAHGIADHALYFDTRSLEWQAVPLPQGTALIIADSGVRRSLTSSAYNQRRAACEQAVELLHQNLPQIHSLRDISPGEFTIHGHLLPQTVRKRAKHVIEEIDRVNSAVTALSRGDEKTFGELMFAGHASLRDLYEVSTPELDALVDIASQLPGCIGARLTGAGFGGCTINLVREIESQAFISGLQEGYKREMGRKAQVYLCKASQGADQIYP